MQKAWWNRAVSYFITDRQTRYITKFSQLIRAIYFRWNFILVHKLQENKDENTNQIAMETVNKELIFWDSDLEKTLRFGAKQKEKGRNNFSQIRCLKYWETWKKPYEEKSNAYQRFDIQGNENNERCKNDSTMSRLNNMSKFSAKFFPNESTAIKGSNYSRNDFFKSMANFDISCLNFTYWN